MHLASIDTAAVAEYAVNEVRRAIDPGADGRRLYGDAARFLQRREEPPTAVVAPVAEVRAEYFARIG